MQAMVNFQEISRRTTLQDVANAVGLSRKTVSHILAPNCKERRKYSQQTIQKVFDTAKEMGYANRGTTEYREIGERIALERRDYLKKSNFESKQAEKTRMEILRGQFFSNKMIAKKVGCSYAKVLYTIGVEPAEITAETKRLVCASRKAATESRRRLILNQKIKQFEQFQKETEAINARAAELEAQAQRIADEAKATREQYSSKVVELDAYRKEAEKAAMALGRNLA